MSTKLTFLHFMDYIQQRLATQRHAKNVRQRKRTLNTLYTAKSIRLGTSERYRI
jgi:hypothetical protein